MRKQMRMCLTAKKKCHPPKKAVWKIRLFVEMAFKYAKENSGDL